SNFNSAPFRRTYMTAGLGSDGGATSVGAVALGSVFRAMNRKQAPAVASPPTATRSQDDNFFGCGLAGASAGRATPDSSRSVADGVTLFPQVEQNRAPSVSDAPQSRHLLSTGIGFV